jgi:hypothetical protein
MATNHDGGTIMIVIQRYTALLLLVTICMVTTPTKAGTSNHRYKKGEHVELWVNKVHQKTSND